MDWTRGVERELGGKVRCETCLIAADLHHIDPCSIRMLFQVRIMHRCGTNLLPVPYSLISPLESQSRKVAFPWRCPVVILTSLVKPGAR